MSEKIVTSVHSDLGLKELVTFSRSPQSRRCWSGTGEVRPWSAGYVYDVDIKAPRVRIVAEEQLGDVIEENGSVSFESAVRWGWPDDVTASWLSYRFTEEEGGTRVDFSVRYDFPGRGAGHLINAARWRRAMQKSVAHYLNGLARGKPD